MKWLARIGLALAALALLATAIGFLMPPTMRVQRSVVVEAKPEAIYPLIASFKDGWSQWTPWKTEVAPSFSGPSIGVGATQTWDDPKMGDGRLIITRADPQRGVEMDLYLMHDQFRLAGSLICEPAGSGTRVTWTDEMELGANPLRRLTGPFYEVAIGREFDRGLATLKRKAEAEARAAIR